MSDKATCPESIVGAGRVLWDRLVAVFDFDEAELAQLEVACHQASDVEMLEGLIVEHGPIVPGSNGQPRLSAVVSECRQSRLALSKLIGVLALPDEADRPMTSSSKQARHAAEVRWNRTRLQKERRVRLLAEEG